MGKDPPLSTRRPSCAFMADGLARHEQRAKDLFERASSNVADGSLTSELKSDPYVAFFSNARNLGIFLGLKRSIRTDELSLVRALDRALLPKQHPVFDQQFTELACDMSRAIARAYEAGKISYTAQYAATPYMVSGSYGSSTK